MRSPISWQGGKGKMRKKLISMFPPSFICYCEAMVGGAWVLFTLPKGIAKTEYINDIDDDLITFWRVVRDYNKEFIESFKYTPKSRTVFYQYRDKYVKKDYANDIERAHIFFYLCKMGFGSRMRGPTFGTSSERASSLNYRTLPRIIDKAWERLQDVMIDNKEYPEFVAERDKDTTHFFFDPPYYDTAGYNSGTWDIKKYMQLSRICADLQGTFLLTINDNPTIRRLFDGFCIHEHEFQYCISKTDNDQIVKELIITNYKVPEHVILKTHIEKKLTTPSKTLQLF